MNRVHATDYHNIVTVGDPRLSPDSKQVAFVRKTPESDEEYEATIYISEVDGGEPRPFTIEEGMDSEPRWSPSGDRLAFVSTRGADDDRPQLWVLPVDGGEARQVTNVAGGVSQLAWRPDGDAIAFVQGSTEEEREDGLDLDLEDDEYDPEEPDPRVIDRLIYRTGTRYFDGKRNHVYVADLGDDSVDRITDGDYDHSSPAWSDETTLYYTSKRTDDPDDNIVVDIFAYDTGTETEEQVLQTTDWQPTIAVTSDDRVAYTRLPEEKASMRQTEIDVFDRATGDTVTLTDGLDRTIARDSDPQWAPEEDELYFLTPDHGSVVLRRVDGSGTADPELVIGGEDPHLTGFSVGANAVAYTQSEWDHPGDVYASTRGGAETNRLTRINSTYLDDRAVSQPEELWFESDDGVEIQGWMLTPPDFDASKTYPLAVEIHGGPHAMWTTSGTMWHEFQTLAANGYVVFWSNPRGSTGYGEAFEMAIERNWGEVTFTDVMAGVDEVAAREYVDEDNMFVTGGSFGGFMTAWTVGHTDRFAGAVSQRGVYDLASFYGSTDAFKLVEWDFGTEPWEEPEFLWEHSPVAYADQVTTPTLVMHADNDYRVPVNNGEMLYLFLKKNGVDTRFVRYPREGHELSRSGEPGHVVDRIERLVRWFDGYSEYTDAPPALERDADAGLSSAGDDESE